MQICSSKNSLFEKSFDLSDVKFILGFQGLPGSLETINYNWCKGSVKGPFVSKFWLCLQILISVVCMDLFELLRSMHSELSPLTDLYS